MISASGDKRIDCAVYGATGHTGRLVAKALVARGLTVRLLGRNLEALAEVATALDAPYASAEAAALAPHLADVGLLINCAGPFAGGLGTSVIEAAIAAGVHYIDSSGEPSFVRETVERLDAPAQAARVCVMPAAAFEAALGDWAADAALAQLGPAATSLAVGYAFADASVTPGTFASIAAELAAPGFVWDHDRWRHESHGTEAAEFDFGPDFGGRRLASSITTVEVVAVPKRRRLESVRSFIALGQSQRFAKGMRALLQSAAVVRLLGGEALLHRTLSKLTPVRTPRPRARFSLVVQARSAGETASVRVIGGSPYALSAEILADAALAWRNSAPTRFGVRSPAEMFEAPTQLASLAARGLITVEQSKAR